MAMKDDLLRYVERLIDGSDISISDNRLSFLVDDFYEEVKIYCNRDDFPQPLIRTTAKIIYAYIKNDACQNSDGTRVNSITEDGRTVSFDLSGIVVDEKNQIYADTLLNRYKKLYRTGNK